MDDIASTPPAPFPAIRGLIARKQSVIWIGTLGVALAFVWLAMRTGAPDFFVVGAIAAAAVYFVLTIAVEVVELVAETLMPR